MKSVWKNHRLLQLKHRKNPNKPEDIISFAEVLNSGNFVDAQELLLTDNENTFQIQ